MGGHPRLLEFLDGILRHGKTRLGDVAARLKRHARALQVDLGGDNPTPDEALKEALTIGARDVLLTELLAMARHNGDDEVLRQLAVSRLPMDATELAHALDGQPGDRAREKQVRQSLRRLIDLSLVTPTELSPDVLACMVHRWTAEALLPSAEPEAQRERCRRAAAYRLGKPAKALDDVLEAVHNLLDAEEHEQASTLALQLTEWLRQQHQSMAAAQLAADVLRRLPERAPNWSSLADTEAQCCATLGATQLAVQRYQQLLDRSLSRAQAEPDRSDFECDLAFSLERMAQVEPDHATEHLRAAHAKREALLLRESNRADLALELARTCVQLTKALGEEGWPPLAQAAELLSALKEAGALAPADAALADQVLAWVAQIQAGAEGASDNELDSHAAKS